MPLASFCSWADRVESYLVENPEDRFSPDDAQIIPLVHLLLILDLEKLYQTDTSSFYRIYSNEPHTPLNPPPLNRLLQFMSPKLSFLW